MKTQEKKNSKLAELAAVAIMMAMGAGSVAHADNYSEGGLQGGGGAAIVCKTPQGTTAQLLDLYNGEIMDSLSYTQVNANETTIIAQAKARMWEAHGYGFSIQFDQELQKVNANWIVLPVGVPVMPANDAGMMIGVPPNCEAKYAVNYAIRNGLPKVLVNNEILNQMSSLQQAALKVHEAVYALRRGVGDQDSVRAQEITSLLVADTLSAEKAARLKELLRSYGDWRDFVSPTMKMTSKISKSFCMTFSWSVVSSDRGLWKTSSTVTEFIQNTKAWNRNPYFYFDLGANGFSLKAGDILEVVSVAKTSYQVKFPDGHLVSIIPIHVKEEVTILETLPDFDVTF